MNTPDFTLRLLATIAPLALLATSAAAQFTVPIATHTNGGGTTCTGDGFSLSGTSVLQFFNFDYDCGEADRGDADNNGVVNFADVTKVLENFSLPCP